MTTAMDINGHRAEVEQTGSGPPVVLVHGLSGTLQAWDGVREPLAEHFRVVAYSLRGAGGSEAPPGPYSVPLLADDLEALIAQLGAGPAALVGHSLGGAVALLAAARRPDLVRCVVAAGVAVDPPEQIRAETATWATTVQTEGMQAVAPIMAVTGCSADFRAEHPERVEGFIAAISAARTDGFAGLANAVSTIDVEGELGAISAPVLFVSGEHDGICPPAENKRLAALVPGARSVTIRACGHELMLECADALVAAIHPFLAEPRPGNL
jgi:pimeloyl-ACP methyl ester carboxylesterase